MFANMFFVFFCAFIAFGNCALVATLQKCEPEDSNCLKKVIKNVLESIAGTGAPEFGIPPLDPMDLNNFKVNAFDVAEITVTEGVVKGIKKCEVVDVKLNMNKGHVQLKLLCDVIAKGKYEVSGSAPEIKDLFGAGSLSGKGNFKVKVEKLLLTYGGKFDIVKRDGKNFIAFKKDTIKYDFDLQGSSHLTLDNLFIGDTDSSKVISDYYNQNHKVLWKDFSKQMLGTSINRAYDLINQFFEVVEVKEYLSGDIDKYVKN